MGGWHGWVAAVGGLLTLIALFVNGNEWLTWVGGIVAIIFGIWASSAK